MRIETREPLVKVVCRTHMWRYRLRSGRSVFFIARTRVVSILVPRSPDLPSPFVSARLEIVLRKSLLPFLPRRRVITQSTARHRNAQIVTAPVIRPSELKNGVRLFPLHAANVGHTIRDYRCPPHRAVWLWATSSMPQRFATPTQSRG